MQLAKDVRRTAAIGAVAGAVLLALRKRNRYSPYGKAVLITGGSRGLGLVLAREFANRGAFVAVCARNDEDLERVRKEFSENGAHFLALRCDLTKQDDVVTMIDSVEQQLGPIDVLVNNAGTIQMGPLENQTIEDFREAMENFWSAVYTSLTMAPRMKNRHAGRIVNIASIGGKVAVPHLLPYCASKFALIGFSKGLRAELAKDGVCVTTAVPGLMRTGSPRNVLVAGQHTKEYGWFILGDSLPGISMNAKRAARKIVNACVRGRSEVVIGLPAKGAAMIEAFAPNFNSMMFAAVNRWMLPGPGDSAHKQKGFESESSLTKSVLTSLTRRAEIENNELGSEAT